MNSVARSCIALLLFLLLPLGPATAESGGVEVKEGKLQFSFGTLYVPQELAWTAPKCEDGHIYVGRSPELRIVVGAWKRSSEVDNSVGMSLLQNDLVVHLENAPSLRLRETLVSPYPWPDSVELRFDRTCAYLGSDAEKTLLIAVQGDNAEQVANAVTASFKESISVSRQGQQKSGATRIHSMLGTAATLLLLAGFFLPAGLAHIVNRRKKEVLHNPYVYGFWGMTSCLVLSLLFSWMILSRFSWTGIGNYGEALGDNLARFTFLFLIGFYFSKRWQDRRDSES
jgi:hypothetical protein